MSAIEHAYSTEREEDEEYRVRSAVVTAIASVRAMDGMSPPLVLDVLHKILQSDDESSPVTLNNIEEERLIHNKKRRKENNDESIIQHKPARSSQFAKCYSNLYQIWE